MIGLQMMLSATQQADDRAEWHKLVPWAASWTADDLSAGSVTSWADGQTGALLTPDATAPVYSATSGPNDTPAVNFAVGRNLSSTVSNSQPNTIVIVGGFNSISSATIWLTLGGNTITSRQAKWQISAGTYVSTGSTPNTADHLFVGYFNGTSSRLDIDGTTDLSGDAGTNDMTAFALSSTSTGNSLSLTVSAVGIYKGDVTTSANYVDLVSWVSSYYGLTIS